MKKLLPQFEHHAEPLLSASHFLLRLGHSGMLALAPIALSLFAGMCGYRFLEGLEWIDAFLNASMLLGGMGPVNPPLTFGGKLFAGFYSLYCGLVVLITAGILFAPIGHRLEHAFFRSVGLSIWEGHDEAPVAERVGWPRVHASCDYHSPLFFQEEFEVELLVEEIRSKAIRYLIRCWNRAGTLIAEGRMAAACVRKDPATGRMKAVPIPQRILDCIETAPPEKLLRPHTPPPPCQAP